MKSNRYVLAALALLVLGAVGFFWWKASEPSRPEAEQHVVINEALRTLLYLPIYHAQERGYFRDEGLDVEIVTGGTATNAFSAMMSGEAQFSVADPMYVPISREQGGDAKVVAQIVGRIAVWALASDPNVTSFDSDTVRGRRVSTHQRPMTAYTYATNRLTALGLSDGLNVDVIQSRPGSEVAPFLAGQADFVVTLEPGASVAEASGAHVVYSWPTELGDRIFTGLMARSDTVAQDRGMVVGVVRAVNRGMEDIRSDPQGALATARSYFPSVEEAVLRRAIQRLLEEEVIPSSVAISQQSWDAAVTARRESGDLRGDAPFATNVDASVWADALSER